MLICFYVKGHEFSRVPQGKRVAAYLEIYLKVEINILFYMNKIRKRLDCPKPGR